LSFSKSTREEPDWLVLSYAKCFVHRCYYKGSTQGQVRAFPCCVKQSSERETETPYFKEEGMGA